MLATSKTVILLRPSHLLSRKLNPDNGSSNEPSDPAFSAAEANALPALPRHAHSESGRYRRVAVTQPPLSVRRKPSTVVDEEIMLEMEPGFALVPRLC